MISASQPVDHSSWRGKKVLITGVCGTVGRELLAQVRAAGAGEIIGLDNNESALFFLEQRYRQHTEARFFLGDVRDRDGLAARMRGVDVVLHAAAFKHVHLCEKSPNDAVATNILGVGNVIAAANAANVERVLFTSSDKAVNPTNVMGTSKLMGERLITAANACRRNERPIFASTRFGNVLGSRGSVIPLFRQQIAAGGPVTITDPAMTRFIMTLHEAVRLVMESTFLAHGGEVFVTKMPVVAIRDLAQVMIEELASRYGHDARAIKLEVIGPRAGEKMYEELLNEEETRRSLELERYFVVLPALKSDYWNLDYIYEGMRSARSDQPYNSSTQKPMTLDALRTFMKRSGLLEHDDEDTDIGG